MASCYKCGTQLPPRDRLFRTTLCEGCGSDVRVCRNCEFYSPGAHWDCRETVQEPVRDKTRANFCDHFRPADDGQTIVPDKDSNGSDGARKAFNSLFDD